MAGRLARGMRDADQPDTRVRGGGYDQRFRGYPEAGVEGYERSRQGDGQHREDGQYTQPSQGIAQPGQGYGQRDQQYAQPPGRPTELP